MLSKTLFYLLPFVLLETVTGSAYDRCDSHEAPAHWPGTCSSQVRGSPINLCGATSLKQFSVSTKFTKKYQSIESGKIIYDPTNLAFGIPKEKPCQLTTDFLPVFTSKKFATTSATWTLQEVRFHLGRKGHTDEGSEHYIEGKQFTGELQYVHFNSKFSSFAEALKSKSPDALLVAAVPVQVGTVVLPALTGLINGLLRAVLALLNSLLGQLTTLTSVTTVVSGANGGLLSSLTGLLGGVTVGSQPAVPDFGKSINLINQAFAAAGTVIETNSTVVGFVEVDDVRLAATKNLPLKHFIPSVAVPELVDSSLAPVTNPVLNAIKPLKPTLNKVIVPLSPLLNAVLCPLEPLLTRLFIVLSPALGPLVFSLGNLLTGVLGALQPVLQPIVVALDDLLSPILGPLLHPVGALLNGLLDPVVGALSPIIASLLCSLVPTLDALLVPVATTLGQVLLPVTPIAASLITQLTELASKTIVVPVLGPVVALLSSLLGTSLTLVKKSLVAVAGALGIKVDQVGVFLGQTVTQLTTILDLGSLLNFNSPHYIYPGSLTTFPCSETATWVVLKNPINISTELLNEIWNAHGTVAKKFTAQSALADAAETGNFRDLQISFNRTIYYSEEYSSTITCTPVQEPHWTC